MAATQPHECRTCHRDPAGIVAHRTTRNHSGTRPPDRDPPAGTESRHIHRYIRGRGKTINPNGMLLCKHHRRLHNTRCETTRINGNYNLIHPACIDPSPPAQARGHKHAGTSTLVPLLEHLPQGLPAITPLLPQMSRSRVRWRRRLPGDILDCCTMRFKRNSDPVAVAM